MHPKLQHMPWRAGRSDLIFRWPPIAFICLPPMPPNRVPGPETGLSELGFGDGSFVVHFEDNVRVGDCCCNGGEEREEGGGLHEYRC